MTPEQEALVLAARRRERAQAPTAALTQRPLASLTSLEILELFCGEAPGL